MQFYTDIHIEEPFFHQMALELNGTRVPNRNGRCAYEVKCPRCGKKKSRMIMGSKNQWLFGCPVDGCKWGCNLHQLIRDYGSEQIIERWNSARCRDDWYPIKNRRKPGPKKNFKKHQVRTPIPGLSNDLDLLRIRGQLEGQEDHP